MSITTRSRCTPTVAALALALAIGSAARGDLASWNVDTSGLWMAPSNWSTGLVPGLSDDVVIDRAGANPTVTFNFNNTYQINSLMVNDPLVIEGGTPLIVSTTTQVQDVIRLVSGGILEGGTVTGQGQILVASNQYGTITNATINTRVNVESNGSLRLQGAWHNGGTLTNLGRVDLGGVFTGADVGTLVNQGSLFISGTLTNTDQVFALSPTGQTSLQGGYPGFGGTIVGGTVTGGAGATLGLAAQAALNGATLNVNASVTGNTSVHLLNGLTVNGTMTVYGGSTTALHALTSQTLGGTGVIDLQGSNIGISNSQVSIGQGLTIRGGGGISIGSGALINNGTLIAESPFYEMSIAPSTGTVANHGLMQVNATGTLRLTLGPGWVNGGTITVNGGRLFLQGVYDPSGIGPIARTGGTVTLGGTLTNSGKILAVDAQTGSYRLDGILAGGTVTGTAGSGLLIDDGSNSIIARLEGVSLDAPVTMAASSRLLITGNLALNDVLSINGNSNLATVELPGSQTISGTGSVIFESFSNAVLRPTTTGTLTLGPGLTVRTGSGSGTVGNSTGSHAVINQGLMSAQTAGQRLTLAGSSFTNHGTIEAKNGGTVLFTGGATSLTNLSGGTLTGGTWRVLNASTLRVPAPITSNAATLILDGDSSAVLVGATSSTNALLNLTSNSGVMALRNGRQFLSNANFANSGSLTVDGLSAFFSFSGLTNTGSLLGRGIVAANLENRYLVAPGEMPGVVGTLQIFGDYTQTTDGILTLELAGTTAASFDRLAIDGKAMLGGTLRVSLVGGFVPAAGQTFDLFDATTTAGQFLTVDLPPLNPGLQWDTAQLYSTGVVTALASPITVGFWTAGAGEWINPANWISASYPDGADDRAIFSSVLNPAGPITVGAHVTVGGVTFDSASTYLLQAAGSASSLTFASTMGQASLVITGAAGANTTTLALPLNLASDLVVNNNATGPLWITGAISGAGNMEVNGKGEVSLRGNSAAWSPASITVKAGLLTSTNPHSFGDPATGTITVKSGASLDITGLASTASSFAKTLILSGAGTAASPGAMVSSASESSLLGTITLDDGAVIHTRTTGTVLTLKGGISGSGPLTKSGPGTLQLHAPASFTGGTAVDAGTLTILTGGSLAGTVTVSSGGRLVLFAGPGNAPAVSPNALVLQGGTVSLAADIAIANLFSPASTSGFLSIENGTSFSAGGTNLIDFSALGPSAVVRLIGAPDATVDPSVTIIPNAFARTVYLGGGTFGTFTVAATIGDVGGMPTALDIGSGQQQVILAGHSTYTGETRINPGATVVVTSGTALGSAAVGTTILAGGLLSLSAPSAEPFVVDGGTLSAVASPSGDIVIRAGFANINATGSAVITVLGGTAALNAAWHTPITVNNGTLLLHVGGSAPLMVNNGSVNYLASGSYPIALSGGTVSVAGASSGAIQVTGGLLKHVPGGSFAAQSVTLAGGRISLGANMTLSFLKPGSSMGIVSLDSSIPFTGGGANLIDFSTFAPNNTLALSTAVGGASIPAAVVIKPEPGGHMLRFGGGSAGGTLTINASLQDAGMVPTKVFIQPGSPLMVLSGTANTYTGTTTVEGPLQVNIAAGLGFADGSDASATIVNAPGRLSTGAGITLAGEKLIVNGGTVTVSTNGPVRLDGPGLLAGTYHGNVEVNAAGTLTGTYNGSITASTGIQLGTSTLAGTSNFLQPVTILAGSTVTVNSASGLGFALGNDATGTTINNARLLTAAGVSLFLEKVTSNGGTLGISTSGPVSLAGGTTTLSGVFNGPISGGGALLPAGGITLGGANSYSAVTPVGPGVQMTLTEGSTLGDVSSPTNITGGILSLNSASAENINLSSGTLNLGAVAHAGTVTTTGGTVNGASGSSFSKPLQLASGTVTLLGTSTLAGMMGPGTFNVGTTQHPAANITVGGAVAGHHNSFYSGTTTFLGPVQFTGNTFIEYGRLVLNGSSSSFNIITIDGGTNPSNFAMITANGPVNIQRLSSSRGELLFHAPVDIKILDIVSGTANFAGGGTFHTIKPWLGVITVGGHATFMGQSLAGWTLNAPATLTRGLKGFQSVTFNATNVANGAWDLKANPAGFMGGVNVNANNTVDRLKIDFTGVNIGNGATLTLLDPLLIMRSGWLDGNLAGVTTFRKIGPGQANFNPGVLYTGTIRAEGGTLSLAGTAGGPVSIGPMGKVVVWNTGQTFVLDNAVPYDGSPALSGGTITGEVKLGAGGSAIGGTLTGAISGGNLIIAGPTSFQSNSSVYTGVTKIFAMMEVFNAGRLSTTSGIEIYPGGHLGLAGTGGLDRVPDDVPLTGNGGTLSLSRAGGSSVQETVGVFTAARGSNTIVLGMGGGGGHYANGAHLVVHALIRAPGATVQFVENFGNLVPELGASGTISLSTLPTLTHEMIGGWAIANKIPGPVNVFEAPHFATYTAAGVVPLSNYQANINAATATDNVNITANATLGASTTINSLRVIASTLNLGGKMLTVDSGGVILYPQYIGASTQGIIQNGTIVPSATTGELIVHGQGTVSAALADGSNGPAVLTLNGFGGTPLSLSGANTVTGPVYVSGTVAFNAAQAVPTTQNLVLNGAAITFPFANSGTITLGPVSTGSANVDFRAGSSGNALATNGIALNAASYNFQAGIQIAAPLAGSGPMTVAAPVSIYTASSNLTNYAGNITINDRGRLRFTFYGPGPMSLGTGTLTINPGGQLYPEQPVSGKVILNGGTLLSTMPGPGATSNVHFAGTLRAAANSTIANINVGTALTIDPGVAVTLADATLLGVSGGGSLMVPEYTYAVTDGIRGALLQVDGHLQIRANGAAAGAGKVTGLAIGGAVNAWTGTLDLTNNGLVIQTADGMDKAAKVAAIANQLARGENGGAWDGTGITSSTLAANATAGALTIALVLADNADLGLATFRGLAVDAQSLIITTARMGDITLDGKVDAFDLNILANHWQQAGNAVWTSGDLTADGMVDAFDLNVLAGNWQFGVIGGGPSWEPDVETFSALPTAVPEPGTLAVMPLASAALLKRRRRRAIAVV